ncbi:hypothetical protein CEP52_002827 [Fusarium oligoseptatum]|uniref:Uncharacterized protein n=1 Tax=Fusarium oligoseptatum TaxID=2604345 RepID=A0A428UBM6_9HYPO|nr:hypothetical protein CEP52_002827 [Fusarium oligoseptatum]
MWKLPERSSFINPPGSTTLHVVNIFPVKEEALSVHVGSMVSTIASVAKRNAAEASLARAVEIVVSRASMNVRPGSAPVVVARPNRNTQDRGNRPKKTYRVPLAKEPMRQSTEHPKAYRRLRRRPGQAHQIIT